MIYIITLIINIYCVLTKSDGHCYHIQFIIVETETKGDYKKYMVLGKHETEDSKVCLLRPEGAIRVSRRRSAG